MSLYQFQKEYLADVPEKYIFACDTGSGKSRMSLAHYDRYSYPKPLLIVAPAAKIRTEDWQREVEAYFADRPLPAIHYYSYEKFSRNPTIAQYRKTGDEGVWRAWLKKYPYGGYHVIADECHRLANPQSGIGKAMFQVLGKADGFSLLSATPLPNSWISACVDGETDVLTENGWKPIPEVTIRDTVAQFNKETREVSFAQPLRVIKRNANTIVKMRFWQGAEQIYTPEHKMLFYKKNIKGGYHPVDVQAKDAKLYGEARIPVSGIGTGEGRRLTDAERVYIALQADGSKRKDRKVSSYIIKLKRPRKIERIKRLLRSSGLRYSEVKVEGYYAARVWTDVDCKKMETYLPIKCSFNLAREILDEIRHWDGHKTTHGFAYSQKDHPSQLDFVEAIACQAGMATTRHRNGYIVHWFERLDRGTSLGKKSTEEVTEKPMYCLTVPTGYFVVRRSGRVWITGNCNYFKVFGLTAGITAFKKRYCHIQTYKGFPEIVEYWREGELRAYWNKIAKPLRKEDCLDLPALTEVEVPLPLGAQYKRIQKERLFGDTLLDNPSALAHALRQATIDNKLPWLDEFLEGVSGHVVIFYTYVTEREAILSLLAKKHKERRVYRQDGERHQVPHRGAWDDIPERSIVLAQYQSGSTGLEMQFASTIVFFSPTYSYALYSQSIGRIERIGQKNVMTLYKLVTTGSIERAVWRVLERKEDFSEQQWLIDNRQQKTIQSSDTGGQK